MLTKGGYMRKLIAVLTLLATPVAIGETVINYDDGSTYTLTEGQEIYISNTRSALFKRQLMKNKDTFFRVQKPWSSRDYVPEPQDPFVVGGHDWCKAYVPWSEGLTFDMITWQKVCDDDNDGKYGCGDTRFNASEDGGVCSS
tara:strand:- start:224 stop:649 length:426 start_codon:yes stop_codon:yes gene_type:complete